MTAKKTAELLDQERSLEFYEDRYEQGYMDEWPAEKKRIITEILHSLDLPDQGAALDFGCGNGVLTEVIRQALPSWEVYGTDTSKLAVANARSRFKGCVFFNVDDPGRRDKNFDLVFTHHVFEHVFDLDEVFHDMTAYLEQESSMLHVLPCGNEGSFEHSVCLLRKDGIDPALGNRFFFEDEAHVRRLTTSELGSLCETKGFGLKKEFYTCQHDGAIDWITDSDLRFVLDFSDSSQAVNRKARRKLQQLRLYLFLVAAIRLPSRVVPQLLRRKNKRLKHYLALLVGLPLVLFSRPVDMYFKKKAGEEWKKKKHDRHGSEMCLYFERGSAASIDPTILS